MKLSNLWCRSISFRRSQLSAYVFSMPESATRANAVVKHISSFNKDVISDVLLAVILMATRFFPARNQRPCLISQGPDKRIYRDATSVPLACQQLTHAPQQT